MKSNWDSSSERGIRVVPHGIAFLASLVLAFPAERVASAADIYWVGYQNGCNPSGPQNASFFHADNWYGYVLPGTGDAAFFGSGFDPGGFGFPGYVYFGDYCVNIGGACGSVTVPAGSASIRELRIQNGAFDFDLGSGNWQCSPPGSATGTLESGRIIIGERTASGPGPEHATLSISRGSVSCTSQTLIGVGSPAPLVGGAGSGTLILSGPNAGLNSVSLIDVGVDEVGVMQVLEGAEATTGETRIGQQYGAAGTLLVSGTGSTYSGGNGTVAGWQLTSPDATRGTLNVEAGGAASFSFLSVASGNNPGAVGAVTVSGPTSTLQIASTFDVGFSAGTGSFDLSSGARCTAGSCRAGTLVGGDGRITVSGAGTRLDSQTFLVIGRFGKGELWLNSGAVVQSPDTAYVASRPSGSGSAHVAGGGRLLLRDFVIGRYAGTPVSVDVDGAGSEIAASGAIDIGQYGRPARLSVGAGSMVSADSGLLIRPSGIVQVAGTIHGAVINHGILSPGDSVGTGSIDGPLTLAPDGRLVIDLAGGGVMHAAAPGSSGDRLDISGLLTLGGILEIRAPNGMPGATPNTYILTAPFISGAFDSVAAPAGVEITFDSTGVQVRVPTSGVAPTRPPALAFDLRVLSSETIQYDVPEAAGPLSLDLFDAAGRRVETLWHGERSAGRHVASLPHSGRRVPSGVYFVCLRADGHTLSRRMVITR